ncbi:MAG: hypothetical protein KDB80_15320 [Planctomycetes bacterium]|nr:hypothetical protein [Planctomycetota bacterium]
MARIVTTFVALLALGAFAEAQERESPFRPFDKAKFVAHLRSLGAGDADLAAYEAQCREESVAHASEAALRRFHANYAAAAALADDGDPKCALELAALIAGGDDPYVRAHARYHLGRHFLDGDDPDKAATVLAQFLRDDRNLTPLDAEVAFFYGSALAEVPLPREAAATFAEFLQVFPDAPERYRAVAAQRKAELEAQSESALHEIADNMKGIGRELRRQNSGDDTQQRQKDVVTKLEKIIEQLEEQEKQSSGAPSGNRQSQSPAANSALPGGESRIGNLHDAPRVAERWGDYKDRERKAIEAEVQTRLSGPWKKMVEEYYKKLNEGSSR